MEQLETVLIEDPHHNSRDIHVLHFQNRTLTATYTGTHLDGFRPISAQLVGSVYEPPENEQVGPTLSLLYLKVIDISYCSSVDYIISGLPKVGVVFDVVMIHVLFFKGEIGESLGIGDGMSIMSDSAYTRSTVLVEEASACRDFLWAKSRSYSCPGQRNR